MYTLKNGSWLLNYLGYCNIGLSQIMSIPVSLFSQNFICFHNGSLIQSRDVLRVMRFSLIVRVCGMLSNIISVQITYYNTTVINSAIAKLSSEWIRYLIYYSLWINISIMWSDMMWSLLCWSCFSSSLLMY